MKIVWELDKPTVRAVYEAFRRRRKIAYTSVMTMMNVLVDKGRLRKEKVERVNVYRPTQPRQKVLGSMVADFVRRVLDGSAKPLLVQLVEDERLSEADLDELRAMIQAQDEEKRP